MNSGTASSAGQPQGEGLRSSSSDDAYTGTSRPSTQHPASPAGAGAASTHQPRDKEREYDGVVDLSDGPDGPDGDALAGLRHSAEYRAAWDMELWKAVQADRFRQQLERQRARALADLARTVKQREEAAVAAMGQRAAATTAKEARLEKELRAVAQREARLAEGERALRRMRQQLLDAQRRVEDEVRAQVRRANDDITHKALLLQDRVKAAEAQAQRADERQRQAQADYLELYEEFHRFRTRQLASAGGGAAEARSRSRGDMDQEGEERLAAQMLRLRAEHQEEMRLLREGLEQRHREELAELLRRNRDLEEQNRRLTGALARRREQLRSLRAGEPAASSNGKGSSSGGSPADSAKPRHAEPLSVSELTRELDRLRRERAHLVEESAGAITESHLVVRRLDARIRQLGEVLEDVAIAG